VKIRAKKKNILKEIRDKRLASGWVPPGQEVMIGNHRIPDGMFYVGRELRAAQGASREPALIDPSLPCAPQPASRTPWMMFGPPTYDRLLPAQRTAYLEWLAGGRRAPDAQDFCPLVFFLGIERRMLHDTQTGKVSNAEILTLIAETERLLRLYSQHPTFAHNAGAFLVIARMIAQDYRPESLEAMLDVLNIPTLAEVGPALFAAAGRPLSPSWAFVLWSRWKDARTRRAQFDCPEMLRDLFALRYQESLPDGRFHLQKSSQPLVVKYLPLNPGLPRMLHMEVRNIHECSISPQGLPHLQSLVDQASAELTPYCRWIAKTRDRTSPAALSLLPPELARRRETEESRRLARWIEETLAGRDAARVRCEDAARHWPVETAGRFTKRALETFATFLERSGYGIVPDPRCGDSLPHEVLVLFRLPGGSEAASPAGEAAAVVLQLAVTVAMADGAVDPRQERQLLEHVEEAAHLGPAERARLQAYLLWLLVEPQGLLGSEKRLKSFSEDRCRAVARFLITLAGADGHVSPEEIRQLKRIYRVLRLDADNLYSDIHSVLAGAGPAEAAAAGSRLALDRRKIEDKLAETEQASTLLGQIFADEEPAAPTAPTAGLDASHAALLREIAGRGTWERADFEERAAALGLLPDGALEMLNEAAFHLCGAPLLEGGETLEIDPEVLREMLP
jgi:tellurite resistance protein